MASAPREKRKSSTSADIAGRMRDVVPMRTRRDVVKLRHALRRPTSELRMLPNALIIGAQRCGTGSLYKYLGAHPCVVPSLRKETEFLSRRFSMGLGWYRAHFPTQSRPLPPFRPFTFEATPDYLFHPRAAERAAALVPDVKIVVLLRDPVERAYSQYRHMVRLGFETLPFDAALEAEASRIRPDIEAMAQDPLHYCRAFLHFSYASRGLYAEQLERWLDRFPRDRFLFLRSEGMYAEPATTYKHVLAFLGLPGWAPRSFRNHTGAPASGRRADISDSARARLRSFFERDQERLASLIGPEYRQTDGAALGLGPSADRRR